MKYLIMCLIIFASCTSKSQDSEDSITYKKDYWENGKLRSILPYKAGVLHGEYKAFYESGKIMQRGFIYKGKSHGTDSSFYENGNLFSISEFDHGKMVNINIWNQNGDHVVADGNGTLVNYYENGQIKDKLTYKDSKLEGEYSSWFQNGVKRLDFHYEKGKAKGIWIIRNEKGEIEHKEEHK